MSRVEVCSLLRPPEGASEARTVPRGRRGPRGRSCLRKVVACAARRVGGQLADRVRNDQSWADVTLHSLTPLSEMRSDRWHPSKVQGRNVGALPAPDALRWSRGTWTNGGDAVVLVARVASPRAARAGASPRRVNLYAERGLADRLLDLVQREAEYVSAQATGQMMLRHDTGLACPEPFSFGHGRVAACRTPGSTWPRGEDDAR